MFGLQIYDVFSYFGNGRGCERKVLLKKFYDLIKYNFVEIFFNNHNVDQFRLSWCSDIDSNALTDSDDCECQFWSGSVGSDDHLRSGIVNRVESLRRGSQFF